MNDIVFCCVCICVTVLLISVLVFIYAFFKQECYCGLRTSGRRLSDIHDYTRFITGSVDSLNKKVNNLSGDVYACKCMLDEISQYYPRLTKEDVERVTSGTA